MNEILNGDNLLSSQRRRDRRARERKGEDARFRPVRGADDPVLTRVVHTTRHRHPIHRVRGAINSTRRVAVHRHGLHLCVRIHHVHQLFRVEALVLNPAARHRHRERRRRRHARRSTAHGITHVSRASFVRRRRRPARVIRHVARRRTAHRCRTRTTRRHTRVFPARRGIDASSDEKRAGGDDAQDARGEGSMGGIFNHFLNASLARARRRVET